MASPESRTNLSPAGVCIIWSMHYEVSNEARGTLEGVDGVGERLDSEISGGVGLGCAV